MGEGFRKVLAGWGLKSSGLLPLNTWETKICKDKSLGNCILCFQRSIFEVLYSSNYMSAATAIHIKSYIQLHSKSFY